jgi:hypothetical protein
MVLGIINFFANTLWRNRANRKEERAKADLRARGVLAPARVVSAVKKSGRSNVDGTFIKIRYVLDVHPTNGAPFRAEFDHMSSRRGYTAIRGQIEGEAGKHVWVTYDPARPSDIIYEYDEQERVALMHEQQLNERRAAFVAAAEPLEPLRKSGAPGHGTIVQVDDLQLPFDQRGSSGMVLHVDVTPESGVAPYRATIPALIADIARAKFSQGRPVYVRYDPQAPQRVVLDAERNRTLPS